VKKSFFTHMYCMAIKVYTCEEAASGPKTFLNIFCKLLQQKEPSPSLTVVLIPISNHPSIHGAMVTVFFGVGEVLGKFLGRNTEEYSLMGEKDISPSPGKTRQEMIYVASGEIPSISPLPLPLLTSHLSIIFTHLCPLSSISFTHVPFLLRLTSYFLFLLYISSSLGN
jgi:hypothetical protein